MMYVFFSEEELCTSPIFQKHLNMALACKDKDIWDLRNELWDLACDVRAYEEDHGVTIKGYDSDE